MTTTATTQVFGRTVTNKAGIITLVIGALVGAAGIAMLISGIVISFDLDYDDFGVSVTLNILGILFMSAGGFIVATGITILCAIRHKSLGNSVMTPVYVAQQYPQQGTTTLYPQQVGVSPYPQQAGVPPYPQQAGISPYPQQEAAPPYSQQETAPPYPQQAAAPSYPQQAAAPPYPQQETAPPYPEKAAAPSYPHQEAAPPYPQQAAVPPYPQQEPGLPLGPDQPYPQKSVY